MRSDEIRKLFLEYFAKNGHTLVPSSSLVPKGDPTLLFTNAGMVQFKRVFLREETREYVKAATCQRCVRAGGKHNDLENVGRTARHHTFFEMLGNFSFGDYFKEDAIRYAWDFLVNHMKLPADKLWITVFETDNEAAAIWKKESGLPAERIVRMGEKDNFWSMGDTGPCGPCSEILIDQGVEVGCGRLDCRVGCDCDRFLELWNLVFMQYNRDSNGTLLPLPAPSIDTGMGLERLAAVMQGKKTNYESDLFMPLIERIESLTSKKYGVDHDNDVSIRAIADHARAITFLISDGVLPSNEGRGYVLRRIIRRAARHGRFLGIKEPFIYKLNDTVIGAFSQVYPEVLRAKDIVSRATLGEEERFFETLERGLGMLDDEIRGLKARMATVIPGDVAFKLYDTYGFPVDLTADIVRREGFSVDEEGFSRFMEEQKKKARQAWKGVEETETVQELYKSLSGAGLSSRFVGYNMEAVSSKVLCIVKDGESVDTAFLGDNVEIIAEETPFYAESGGQAGDTGVIVGKGFVVKINDTKRPFGDLIVHFGTITEGSISVDDTAELLPDLEKRAATCRNHTATHILHAALRNIVGSHARQSGSLVTPKGFRFDFNHFEPLSDDTIKRIEEVMNGVVLKNIEVKTEVLPYKAAIEKGALAFFGEKYGETVRLVRIDGVSAELCGGTHVKRTGDIGLIKITSEGSVASGVRRIEAVTGIGAFENVSRNESALRQISQILKVPRLEIPDKVTKLLEYQKELEKEIERLKGRSKATSADKFLETARKIDGVNVLAMTVDAGDAKDLRETADALRAKMGSGIVILGCRQDGKALLLAAVTKDLTKRFSAGEIIKRLAPVVGGKGGGREDMAQAGGKDADKINEAIKEAYRTVEEMAANK